MSRDYFTRFKTFIKRSQTENSTSLTHIRRSGGGGSELQWTTEHLWVRILVSAKHAERGVKTSCARSLGSFWLASTVLTFSRSALFFSAAVVSGTTFFLAPSLPASTRPNRATRTDTTTSRTPCKARRSIASFLPPAFPSALLRLALPLFPDSHCFHRAKAYTNSSDIVRTPSPERERLSLAERLS